MSQVKTSRTFSAFATFALLVFGLAVASAQKADAQFSCPDTSSFQTIVGDEATGSCGVNQADPTDGFAIENRLDNGRVIFQRLMAGVANTSNFTIQCVGSGCNSTSLNTLFCYAGFGFGNCDITFTYTDSNSQIVTLTAVAANNTTNLTNISVSGGGFTSDTTAPVAQSLELINNPAANESSVVWRLTFDEAVVNLDSGDFTLVATGSAGGSIGTPSAQGGGVYHIVVSSITGDGSLQLNFNAGTDVEDSAGNSPPNAISGDTHTVDRIAPPRPSQPAMMAATDTGVSTSDAITANNLPAFTSGVIGTSAEVTISPGGITDTLSFPSGAGSVNFSPPVPLAEGSYTFSVVAIDDAGNRSFPNTLSFVIDNTPPADPLISFSGGLTTTDATPDFSVTLPPTVAQLEIRSSIDSTVLLEATSATSGTFTSGALSDGDHTIQAFAIDAAGNQSGPGVLAGGLTVDATAPFIQSVELFSGVVSPTDADVVSWLVTFSEDLDIATISGADFVATGTTATPTVSHLTDATFEVSLANGDMADLNATVSIALAPGATITDALGNALTDFSVAGTNNNTIEVINDTSPPVVQSITLTGSPAPNASSVVFQVAFDEVAQVIETGAFSVTTTGAATGSVSSVSASSGQTVDVTVDSISGEGTIRLDLDASSAITDGAGNGNGTNGFVAPFTSGDTHTVDAVAPAAPTIDMESASDTGVSEVDNITNDTTPLFVGTVPAGATSIRRVSGASFAVVPVTGSTWSYTPSTPLSEGPQSIEVYAVDAAGNESPTATLNFTIDTTAPVVQSLAIDGSPSALSNEVTWRLTFNEEVAGLNLDTELGTVFLKDNLTSSGVTSSFAALNAIGGGVYTITLANVFGSGDLILELGSGSPVRDLAGNGPPAYFVGETHTVGTLSPPTISLSPASDTGVSADDGITSVAQPTFIGSAPLGATHIDLDIAGSTVSVPVSGPTWSHTLSSPLSDGNYFISARARDSGGNLSEQQSAQFVIDTSGPELLNITRNDPTDQFTTADQLIWLVEFDEAVDLSSADFSLQGTSATVVSVVAQGGAKGPIGTRSLAADPKLDGSKQMVVIPDRGAPRGTRTWLVTAAGGDLAGVNGVVRLRVSGSLEDRAGNTLASTTPSGSWEDYQLQNIVFAFTDLTLQDPASEPTNADSVTWRIDLSNSPGTSIDASDFTVSGTTATLSLIQQSFHLEVTASGGDLASLDGEIELGVASGQDMTDVADTPLSNPEFIASADARRVEIDNTGPELVSIIRSDPTTEETDADTLLFELFFNEPMGAVSASDITVTGTTADVSVELFAGSASVTLSGGDLAELNGEVSIAVAENNAITDRAGNALVNTTPTTGNDNSYILLNDVTNPSVTLASGSSDPVSGAFEVTATFSEAVTGFALTDFTVGNGDASDFTAVSATEYSATITPTADGAVTVDVAAGVAEDAAGNGNTGAETFTITADATAPEVTITSEATSPVAGPFAITITFSETVTGFTVDDLVIEGAEPGDLEGEGAAYTVTLTPGEAETITVDIAADAASDAAGNGSLEAETFSITVDDEPPAPALTVPGETTEGAFTLTVDFGEPVTGFEVADLALTNAQASDLFDDGAGMFTLTVTPETLGLIEMSLPEGAAQDAAGNNSLAAAAVIEAVSRPVEVAVTVDESTADPTDIKGVANITNPGSQDIAFRAFADVPWLRVTPTSGVIPALGDIELTVEVTDAVNDLEPGDYTGTVTVVRDVPAGSSATGASPANETETIIVEIPVSVTLEQRFGDVTLVVTTPSGASGEASFSYSSGLEALDGLTLTTSNGRASQSAGETLFGTYALSQTLPAGWRVESITCAGDLDGGSSFDVDAGTASIDLDPGESLVCTFENVRDEEAVRIATQRAIRGFMVRRADRIIEAAPDLSRRFEDRAATQRGSMGADVDGSGRYQMAFTASLSGMRNAAEAREGAAQFANPERPVLDGWDVWLAAEVSGVRDDRAGENAESEFGVVQLGVDYQIGADLIVGALAQHDWMSETSGEVFEAAGAIAGARVNGRGWMAGPYAVWRIKDSLVFDGLAMYGRSDNEVDPLGLYEDDFETDRFMVRANLTGEFGSGAWRLRPQAGLSHFEETQQAYTDSLGITIPEQTIAIGRLRAGPEVIWRNAGEAGGWLELRTAVNAVWDYQAADLLSETGQFTGGEESLRADARIGVVARTRWGALIGLETGYAGLGQGEFEARSLRFELRIPFGAAGSGRGGGAGFGHAGAAGSLFGAECDSPHAGFEQAAMGRGACQGSWR